MNGLDLTIEVGRLKVMTRECQDAFMMDSAQSI